MTLNKLRQASVVIAVLAVIIVNALANALPINGLTTGEISDSFDVFFVPAGYVFSIWGLIYLATIAYAIYQTLPAQRNDPDLSRIGFLFVFASIANIAWIFLWHHEQFPLTVIAMLALLGSLVAIYLRLDIGHKPVSRQMKWFVHLPFSIYLGWITVATIANITTLLAYWEWGGWGIAPEIWAVIMLAAGTVVGALVSLRRGDVAFAVVLVWAFSGIAIKQNDNTLVATSSWIATALTVAISAIGSYKQSQKDNQVQMAT
jgi:hypothetical protein